MSFAVLVRFFADERQQEQVDDREYNDQRATDAVLFLLSCSWGGEGYAHLPWG